MQKQYNQPKPNPKPKPKPINDLRMELFNSLRSINPSSWRGAWVAYSWKQTCPNKSPVLLTLLKSVNSIINRNHGIVYRYENKRRSVYFVKKEDWEQYLSLLYFYLFKYDGNIDNTTFTNKLPF